MHDSHMNIPIKYSCRLHKYWQLPAWASLLPAEPGYGKICNQSPGWREQLSLLPTGHKAMIQF